MPQLTLNSTFPLPNSPLTIPRLGFGVYQSHGATCIASCQAALAAGYRHIDSAQYYGNEAEVHAAVVASGLPRGDVFLTTKILSASTPESAYRSIVASVSKTGGPGGYADLFLIHSAGGGPRGRRVLWQALERAHGEGRVRAIGVSNFGVGHIEEMKGYAKIWPPQVNQIELHPWCQQREVVEYCKEQGIVVQAYCPLVRNRKANDKTLNALAEKYRKSTGQILIRYSLQKQWSPLPKSDTPSRISANADVYDFEIDARDMEALDSLDQGDRGALVEAVSNS